MDLLMDKKCWIDVETSGLDPHKACILTMGVLIDIDDEIKEELSLKMQPFKGAEITSEALKVNGLKESDFKDWPSCKEGYLSLMDCLKMYIDRFKKEDKFVFCAYNANFDDQFVRSLFKLNWDKYYGSYFFWPKLDVQTFVAMAIAKGLRLPNFKLSTICEFYGIKLDAHDALSDIKATRILYKLLRSEI
jgi:DNA polymerase-3 subunit epsilon